MHAYICLYREVGLSSRGFCLEGFVRGGFCPSPILSEYIPYNRKLNITFNFKFHMYEQKLKSVMSHALDPLPSVTNCHTFSDPLPLEHEYFIDSPISVYIPYEM